MGREEQAEEREVLASIFPEEITDIAEDEFRVAIQLEISNEYGDDSEPPTIILSVKYPEAYPDEAPFLDLLAGTNANSHQRFNLAADKAHLLQIADDEVQQNLGMAMIYTVVAAIKEAAEQLAVNREQEAEQAHEEAALEAERQENAKFVGEPVNAESFLKWRDAFRREMAADKRKKEEDEAAERKKKGLKEPGEKLSGRQLWEKGLAGKGDEEEEDDGLPDAAAKLKVED